MALSWCDLKLWKKKTVWFFSCWQKIAAMTFSATWTGAKWSETGHDLSSNVPLSSAILLPALLGGLGGGNLSLLPDSDTLGDKEACSCWPRGCPKHTHQNPSKQMHQRILPGQAVLPSLWQCTGDWKDQTVSWDPLQQPWQKGCSLQAFFLQPKGASAPPEHSHSASLCGCHLWRKARCRPWATRKRWFGLLGSAYLPLF